MKRALALALVVLAAPAAQAAHGAGQDTYVLSVSVSGPGKVKSGDGQINCPKSCSGKYDAKTQVKLTASADSGAELAGWKGCDSEKGDVCTLAMNKDRTASATFTEVPPGPPPPPPGPPPAPVPSVPLGTIVGSVRLAVGIDGEGRVASEPAGISCPPTCTAWYRRGARIHLTPTASPGWVLGSWSGDCSDFENCTVSLDGNRQATIRFGPNIPPPPSVRFNVPARGSFFLSGDIAAQGFITAAAGLGGFCLVVDAPTIPAGCSARALVTGSNFSGRVSTPPGRHTIDAWIRDARGRTAHDSVPVEVADEASGLDIRVTALSITQGAQEYNPYEVTSTSGPLRARYTGAKLARHMPTVVRVFAQNGNPTRVRTLPGVRALLFGTNHGLPLPGSPLTPSAPLDVGPSYRRSMPNSSFTFTLPQSWADGTMDLRAVVNPSEVAPSYPEPPAARVNNSIEVTGIRFEPMRYAAIGAARICYWEVPEHAAPPSPTNPTPAGGSLNCPGAADAVFDDLRTMMPTRMVGTTAYSGELDMTAAVYCDAAWHAAGRCEHEGDVQANLNDLIQEWDIHQRGPRIGRAIGVQTRVGGWAPPREWAAVYNAIVNGGAPRMSVAHEYMHTLGFWHASNCGHGLDRGPEDLLWPDGAGGLLGEGLDRRGTGDPAAPYRIFSYSGPTRGIWDIMSYCATGEDTAWMSPRNWNALIDRFRSDPPSFERAHVAVGPSLRVTAMLGSDGRATIDRVEPGSGAPSALDPTSPFELVALDEKAGVLARVHAAVVSIHTHGGGEWAILTAEVPAPDAAYVELRRDDQVLARAARSRTAPVVSFVSPKAGDRLPGTGAVHVRWTASDADGDPLTARVEYSLDDGKAWKALTVDAAGGSADLPASLFAASRAARVRVAVNDGFNETTVVSGRLTAAGRPPSARIDTPESKARFAGDELVVMSGSGSDDRGDPIPARSMTWYEGARTLGHGTGAAALLAPGRRVLRLVVRDRLGRTASARTAVVVAAAKPFFLRLGAPRRVARAAHSVSLVVSASVPSTLHAAGARFAVDRRIRRISVPVKPGHGTLRLPLVLSSGGKTTRVTVNVRRP